MTTDDSDSLFVGSLFQKSMNAKKIAYEHMDSIRKLTGDASTRKYYRVEANSASYVVFFIIIDFFI